MENGNAVKEKTICPKCYSIIKDEQKFCPMCGRANENYSDTAKKQDQPSEVTVAPTEQTQPEV